MTCIIGFTKKGRMYMGGDSAGVGPSFSLKIRRDRKVFIKGNMIFGFTSSFRMGQILQNCFEIPRQPYRKNDFEYMCSDFIDALRKTLKDKGFITTKDGNEQGGTFLVGYKGTIYQVNEDFQVGCARESFDACGCGEDVALGAMAILVSEAKEDPKTIIRIALETAERFSAGVRGPFTILSLDAKAKPLPGGRR